MNNEQKAGCSTLESSVKPETRNLKRAFVVGIISVVLAGLTACQPVMSDAPSPVPTVRVYPPYIVGMSTPTPTPTSTATSQPTIQPTNQPTNQPTPIPTPVPTTDIALIRGPYLQSVTTSTIIVAWETDLPGPGEVAYGRTAKYGASAADSAMGTRHAVTLTDLAPYTIYHYRVESGGAPLSTDATFRTTAGLDQAQFTFVVFGDTRTQHTIHQAVVERVVAQEPDFVLHTGDLVEIGSAIPLWETFFEIERELMARVPLFPALGNHEGSHPHYFDLFYLPGNERWYAFDCGNARFVCLEVDGFVDFDPQSEQYAWLEETLSANTQPWLFIYFHIPPYSSVQDSLEDDVRRALIPLFEQYGVDVVFNGHKHNYERNEVNGVTYVVTAGGGAPLYAMQEREPTQVAFALEHHFVLVEIDGHHLQATAISSTGEVLDEFEHRAD